LDSPKDEVHLPTKTQGPALHGLDLAPELEAAGDKVPGSYLAIVVGPSATGVEITEPLTWGENDTNSRTTKRVVGLNTIFFLVEGKVVPSFMIDYRLFEFWQPFPNNVLVPSDEALDGDGESDKTTEDLSDLMDGGEGSDAPKKEFKKAQSTKALMQTKEYQDKLRELLGDDDSVDDEDEDKDLDDLPPLDEEEVPAPGKGQLKQKIFFAYNKAIILEKSFNLLNEVADAMLDRAKMTVRIEGHTDSKGRASYNQKLSQRRAESVLRYMESKGVRESRMTSAGFGETKPRWSNRSRTGREKNRRVEFHIVSQ
jgi:outer membrane protein OmpA-like peptidoglycan-associated protein